MVSIYYCSLMFTFLAAYSVVFIDLYLTLKNPFYPRGKRVIWYKIYLILCFLVGLTMIIKNPDSYVKITLTIYISLYVMTLIPAFLVVVRLCKKGTSKQLRKLVVRRHLIFFAIYTFYFTILLSFDPAYGFRGLFSEETWEKIIFVYGYLGAVLAGIRLFEPHVWGHFKRDIAFWKKKKEPVKDKFSSEPLCAFANSAMNIEFVYQILLGTRYFLESRTHSAQDKKTSKLKISNKGN